MNLLFAALVVISLVGVKFSRFHEDYIGTSQTTAIKGILAVLIIFSHMSGYISIGGRYDSIYSVALGYIGQLMVTMFFFYSGYGLMESIRSKPGYGKSFFKTRFLRILVHFDLAVLLFAILNLILKIEFPAEQWLVCWFGWGAIGNSNWFVFDTLVFYLITLVGMALKDRLKISEKLFCTVITVLSVLFFVALKYARSPGHTWWYDTIFCFPAGFWYSTFKRDIEKIARKPVLWWTGLAVIGAAFAVLYLDGRLVPYSICTAVFCLLVVWITMKVRFVNPVLLWLGRQSFSIYILQRIPMIVLTHMGLADNKYLFAALAIVITCLMSAAFTKLLGVVDGYLFRKKASK